MTHMNTARWYLARLRGMGVAEVLWRAGEACRRPVDRLVVGGALYPSARRAVRGGAGLSGPAPFRVVPSSHTPAGPDGSPGEKLRWEQDLVARAQLIRRHRLTYFDLDALDHGDPVRWNRDHALQREAPLRFSPSIDYRDSRVAGDCKLVWEPNRHHHLVVLGRAYRATGDAAYAAAVAEQLASWLDQSPFGRGMNWRSPLELGVRLVNWVWALDLIRDAGAIDRDLGTRLLHAAYLHLREIRRSYSRGSSANNHLVGEAAGVFIGAHYFRELAVPETWRRKSREILEAELIRQTFPDGCTREQAFGYHLFVLQLFLLSGHVGRLAGDDFSDAYWARLEKMAEFAGLLAEGGTGMPMVGDADDGYALDLGPGGMDLAGLFATAAILFRRPHFRRWAGGLREMPCWLFGDDAGRRFESVPAGEPVPLAPRGFTDAGYYLLQCGDADSPERISVLFDCGELGFGSIAAHGHADALSVVLRAFGREVLVDPGTYDYFTHPAWRAYFRSTRAHNTLVVDGQDQSVMLGPFLWGRRARACCLEWRPSAAGGGVVVGEHDGYTRLGDPVRHRRSLELHAKERTVVLRDEVVATGSHELEFLFHFAEGCLCSAAGGRIAVETGAGRVLLEPDSRLAPRIVAGGDAPGPGWVSRSYHRKASAPAVIAAVRQAGSAVFEHRITIGPYEPRA